MSDALLKELGLIDERRMPCYMYVTLFHPLATSASFGRIYING